MPSVNKSLFLIWVIVIGALITGCSSLSVHPSSNIENENLQHSTGSLRPGFPESSASAITSPPANMAGINTHTDYYGTGADPNIITLGPTQGGCSGCPPYPNKTSMEFELSHASPVLAPLDMVLIGFDNRNAKVRIGADGELQAPFNDLELCFESISPDWPGMILCTYHLLTSPLITGHTINPACGEIEEWIGTHQAAGHIFFEFDDYLVANNANTAPCQAQIGRIVKQGEIIGYAGSVGDHSMAPFRIKVPHASLNPHVRKGDDHLHWVQPGSFFYWMCYSPEITFQDGVLAYPFECGGYELPEPQADVSFKYPAQQP